MFVQARVLLRECGCYFAEGCCHIRWQGRRVSGLGACMYCYDDGMSLSGCTAVGRALQRPSAAPWPNALLLPCNILCCTVVWCRRCLCEWLQTDAISRGLAAAATGGARAAVQAAVAAERHEVGTQHTCQA